jgi:hypothetical protein
MLFLEIIKLISRVSDPTHLPKMSIQSKGKRSEIDDDEDELTLLQKEGQLCDL